MKSRLRELAVRVAIGVVAGCVVGLVDLWIFELSFRGFFAGLAGGVGYFLVVTIFYLPIPLRQQPRPLLVALAVIAGSVGATCWWLVCRSASLWLAILIGAILALSHFAADGLFFSRR